MARWSRNSRAGRDCLAAAQAGSRDAQAELLRSVQDSVFRFCASQLGDVELARDATQETALRMLNGLSGFRGQCQLRTWACGIALNVCREMRRKTRQDLQIYGGDSQQWDEPSPGPEPSQAAIGTEDVQTLERMLGRLPERQREAIALRYLEELSTAEAALAMDVAPGTVKATLSQALRNLRTHFGISNETITKSN